ncbi:FlhB-like flagellar biosynthesis protein [Paenibacillus vulneris]|uniref:EscU/YscU/HrcU family type III secretion system export apparatus switch protein n=1 Tax=Paenibacillus vulneris TaxID=1133364 RepID=A0ABW3UWQ9_9BACL|nr:MULTISPECIES: EscU/YscU/HrcU family type III secretion system export apparatus switch protein [unclassified Paenibacillus]MBE1446383.1 flagellar biosynthesis protein [Paenibacillus sp. OAS669]
MSRERENPSEQASVQPTIKKAVALKYAPDQGKAPVLIAKGKGHIAEAILKKAMDNGIPVQEDSSLVEVLSKLDLDQEIPPELYNLVAEILSFIYRSDQRAKQIKENSYG